jgi:hypothetical protein
MPHTKKLIIAMLFMIVKLIGLYVPAKVVKKTTTAIPNICRPVPKKAERSIGLAGFLKMSAESFFHATSRLRGEAGSMFCRESGAGPIA